MATPAIITDHLPELTGLCQRHGVARLWVFGSATGSDPDRTFDPSRSDIDFLVEFLASPAGGPFRAYFDLRENLESLFGRKVDLVTVGAMTNPYFRASVERTRVPVYAAA
jgi:predicted nucleotidyltransferase